MFKFSNNFPEHVPKGTDLAKKRLELHNERIRAKRKLLDEHKGKGTLDKAIISKIYKTK